ncbi:histidinol-phosphate transaminase [Soonwooa sp.]|uniref:histidinol-phosphate transaminase n=1 Tax=Soonwooa sp. TaxID=1938592 RepID=UPI0028A1DB32|nr:histidinol-phosphate transaminase [Soonwooa sp.]
MENPIQKFVRPNILALQPYISFRDTLSDGDYTLLDANENPFGTFNRYPDSTQKKLKQKLSEIKNVPSSQIALGNGSDEMIDLIIKIFCDPKKDAIVVMNPSFAMYSFYATINENKIVTLDLDTNFQLQKEEYLNKAKESSAKVLFLCSPNNQTGNSIDDLEFYIKNFDGIVVVDEAYIEFSNQTSILEKLNEFENLIVLQSLSKARALAGLRIGMALSSEFIISLINKTKAPYNISEVIMKMALQELEKVDEYKSRLQEVLVQKSILKQAFENSSSIKKVYDSDANFFLVEVENCEAFYDNLIQAKILCSKRFPTIPNALRINVGTAEENQKLIQILK